MKSENPNDKLGMSTGDLMNYLPTDKFSIPVDIKLIDKSIIFSISSLIKNL